VRRVGSDDTMKSAKKPRRRPTVAAPDPYLKTFWVCSLGTGAARATRSSPGRRGEKTDGVVILTRVRDERGAPRAPFNKDGRRTHAGSALLHLRHIWGDPQDWLGKRLS